MELFHRTSPGSCGGSVMAAINGPEGSDIGRGGGADIGRGGGRYWAGGGLLHDSPSRCCGWQFSSF